MSSRFGRSLATRIAVVTAAIISLAAMIAGAAIYNQVRQSLNAELKNHLKTRLAWLQSSVELDEGRLELESKAGRPRYADSWRVSTKDGRELWSSDWSSVTADYIREQRTSIEGPENGPIAPGAAIEELKNAAPGSNTFYHLPDNRSRIELVFVAAASNANARAELGRIALAIWTIGPLTVLILTLTLAFFIRRQLAPFTQIAQRAQAIGPETLHERLGEVGTGSECLALRDALNHMLERLDAGLERERQFAAMAAHELRTPLAQLRTNIEVTLRRERESADYKTALAQSLIDVERLQTLIENLLFLVRDQSAGRKLEPVSLERIVTQAAAQSSVTAAIPDKLAAVNVMGEENVLVSAVRNVLDNARKYAPATAPELAVERHSDTVEFTVRDSGPGIPESERERIFQPLIRLDHARSIGESADGFGLGLTIARVAVRACGSELICRARSDGGAGSEFVFTLRAAPDAR